MELKAASSSILFFILLFILLLSFLLLIKSRITSSSRCNCEICSAYLTSSWKKEFPNLSDWFTHLLKKSATKTIQIHVINNTITANPSNVEYILKTKFQNYPKGKPFSSILGDFLGRGIFNVDGDLWRFQKKLACLELDRLSVRSYALDIINSETRNRLVPLLNLSSRTDAVLDLQDVFKRFSFDVICKFSFGVDPRCLELNLPMSEFAEAFDLASRLSAERALNPSRFAWKLKRVLNVGSERKLKSAIKLIDVLAKEVIRQRGKIGFSQNKDLLSRFMRSTNDEKFLRDIVVSFLLAGRDTVASGLTSFLWLIIKNPETAEKIREEADRVIGPTREPVRFDELRKLVYLQAVVYESMRLYPPIQFDSKFCLNDDVLPDGSFVKSGDRVTYHPYAMGRVDEIWGSDSSEFRPERWLPQGNINVNPFKYPVFQGGFRVCLGKEMAILELQTVALFVVRRFAFEFASAKHAVTPMFSPGLTATFSDGLPVFVRTWDNSS